MSIDVPELADLEQVRGRWRTAVAGVLSKSTRKDPEQLGDEPEQLLETPTYDGIAIRALYTALDELPANQRDVFVAHELEGRSFKELAGESGVSVNTLLARKRYAVLHLRASLQAVYDELEI